MSKVCIVGDTHFSPKQPMSRKDNYPETLLNKLDNLLELCKSNYITDVIFLGDLINNNQMTMEYFIILFKHFTEFTKCNIKLHTIIGNHDINHGNEEFLDKSPLTILFESKLFNNKDFIIDNCRFTLKNYYDDVDSLNINNNSNINILIGHYFYLSGFNDTKHTLLPEKCKELIYDYYFLGHDHTPYEPLCINGYEVHRPGSFSRATSETCQVSRDTIQVCIFDTDTLEVEYKNIPNVLPSKDVYKESKLISKLLDKEEIDTTLSKDIDDLINDLSFNFSGDIYKVLDEMNLKENIKNIVVKYLEEEGIYR